MVATVDGQRVPLNPSSQAWALDVWRDHAPAGRADDLDAAARFLNADPWRVHAVLEQQHYRLAWWRLARDESPYRRFFDINGLVGVRVEDPAVFDAVHTLVGELVRDGSVDGLRVDHVDGLADPDTYLARLAALAPGTPILVEKILTADEPLPAWPVAGTTGYEAAAAIVRLFIQGRAERPVTGFYRAFTRQAEPWPEVVRAARTTVLNDQLGGDAWHVAALFAEACRHDVHLRDFSHKDCDALVRAIVTEMPTYRTYVRPGHVSPDDHARLDVVFREVRQRYGLPPALVDAAEAAMRDVAEPFAQFVRRLQQLSTAVVAKGDEDTALYRDARLLALNEVGADPSRFSMAVGEFHRTVARWQRDLPFGLRSTSTHDTKRGEDVRVRLTVLTERWPSWVAHVKVWSRRAPRGAAAIDRALEYYLYQTLVGAWPLTRQRTCEHAVKAAREAKRHTSWTAPDAAYEARVIGFVNAIFDDDAWTSSIDAFVGSLHPADWHKALAQLLIKLTIPGVPDLYQGSELWDLNLCDPDNRRPVDFDRRAQLLASLTAHSSREMTAEPTGAAKLHVLQRTLALKARCSDLGATAPYQPLGVRGRRSREVLAFRRGSGVAVVTPLRTADPAWPDTVVRLPAGRWEHVLAEGVFAGGEVDLAELFSRFPVALLTRTAA